MNKFDTRTVELMRSVLEEVCSHIPAGATEARTFVAAKILECARRGNQGRDHLLETGRRAVIEQFGSIAAVRRLYGVMAHDRGALSLVGVVQDIPYEDRDRRSEQWQTRTTILAGKSPL
jgi:hypothetical protein